MKAATFLLMKHYIDSGKLTPGTFSHSLTDEELLRLVELEYGQTLQDVLQLFTVMCKKYVKERK